MRMVPDEIWEMGETRTYRLLTVNRAPREVVYTPYDRPWTWKPLNRVYRQRRYRQRKEAKMADENRSEAVMRNLAHELLTEDECYLFKQAIHHFRVSHSVTSFCQQLKPIINTTQKILLLVELTNRMPRGLQEDFHRLCSLQFPNYDGYLKLFINGNASTEMPRVVGRDTSGRFRIISRGNDKKMMMKYNNQKQVYELHSLPGTSVTSGIYSNTSDSDDDDDDEVFEMPDNKENQGRATPIYLKGKKNVHKVFLNRHEDGSLGLGITGGKEFGTSITISVVEEGGPAANQGLKIGDQILEVNGHTFHDVTHSEAVQVMRSAWNLIIIIERPSNKDKDEPDNKAFNQIRELDLIVYPSSTGRLGCVSQRLNNQTLLVTRVEENSSASKAGLKAGDNIIKVDSIAVHTLSEKQIVMLTNSKRINLTIRREGYFTGKDKDLTGEQKGFVYDFSTDFISPQKRRGMNMGRSMSEESRARSAEPRYTTITSTGNYTVKSVSNIENTAPKSPQSIKRFIDEPEHLVYGNKPVASPNWVLTPKPRESRYTQKKNTYNRDYIVNSFPSHLRSVSEGRDMPGRYIHVPKESRVQNVGVSRYVRNRSYSPHRTAINKIHHDDNVIRAIQSGLEKRQRAVRMSHYQMPDPVDYEWEL